MFRICLRLCNPHHISTPHHSEIRVIHLQDHKQIHKSQINRQPHACNRWKENLTFESFIHWISYFSPRYWSKTWWISAACTSEKVKNLSLSDTRPTVSKPHFVYDERVWSWPYWDKFLNIAMWGGFSRGSFLNFSFSLFSCTNHPKGSRHQNVKWTGFQY